MVWIMKLIFKLSILLISTSCLAAETEKTPELTINFGLSPFLGVLGAEYQRQHHAVGIGYPNRLSYRYFMQPHEDSKFWGAYTGSMQYSDIDETVDDIEYQDLKTKYVGVGIGYRWQWPSGWNTNISLSVHYYDYDFSNPDSTQQSTENGYIAFPGMSIGYKF